MLSLEERFANEKEIEVVVCSKCGKKMLNKDEKYVKGLLFFVLKNLENLKCFECKDEKSKCIGWID